MALFWLSASIGLGPAQRWGPRKNQTKTDPEKCLISVSWSVNGIHSLFDVPKGTTHNSRFLCDVVVLDLLENISAYNRRRTLKRVWVHIDNARAHNSEKSNECLTEFRARRVPHPAYRPDCALNDFFFGIVKTELQNHEIHSKQDLILGIKAIFEEISNNIICPQISYTPSRSRDPGKPASDASHHLITHRRLIDSSPNHFRKYCSRGSLYLSFWDAFGFHVKKSFVRQMEQSEQRFVIKFLFVKGIPPR
jgi:hypothetical protein